LLKGIGISVLRRIGVVAFEGLEWLDSGDIGRNWCKDAAKKEACRMY